MPDFYKESTVIKLMNQVIESLKQEKEELVNELEALEKKQFEDRKTVDSYVKQLKEQIASLENKNSKETSQLQANKSELEK